MVKKGFILVYGYTAASGYQTPIGLLLPSTGLRGVPYLDSVAIRGTTGVPVLGSGAYFNPSLNPNPNPNPKAEGSIP